MKSLYLAVKGRIEDQCPSIKYVKLFNNQFLHSNNDNVDKNDQEAFPYPCCFIEFPGDNQPSSSGYGAKRLEVQVRLHIGFVSYKLEALDVFDVAAEVQEAIENWGTDGITPLTYLSQRMDHDHDNVYIYTFDFMTNWSDDTAYVKRDLIENEVNRTLEANIDLDIDNIVIRTGDGEV